MHEILPQIRPSFNRTHNSLGTRSELLSADTGALVQREVLDRTGFIDWLTVCLHDPRHRISIRNALAELLDALDSCCWSKAGAASPTSTV